MCGIIRTTFFGVNTRNIDELFSNNSVLFKDSSVVCDAKVNIDS